MHCPCRRDGSSYLLTLLLVPSFHPSFAHLKLNQSEQSFLHLQNQRQRNGCDPPSQSRSCETLPYSSAWTQPSPHLWCFHSEGEMFLTICKIFLNIPQPIGTQCLNSILEKQTDSAPPRPPLSLGAHTPSPSCVLPSHQQKLRSSCQVQNTDF